MGLEADSSKQNARRQEMLEINSIFSMSFGLVAAGFFIKLGINTAIKSHGDNNGSVLRKACGQSIWFSAVASLFLTSGILIPILLEGLEEEFSFKMVWGFLGLLIFLAAVFELVLEHRARRRAPGIEFKIW